MTKKIISVILLMCVFLSSSAFAFNDVPTDYPASKQITELSKRNILTGYPDGGFHPENPITRAEMAVIIFRTLQKNENNVEISKNLFDDVADNHWANIYIGSAVRDSIISGDGNGLFRPEDKVSYAEAIKMIVCTFGGGNKITPVPGDWSAGYINYARESKLIDGIDFEKNQSATRADVATMIYNGIYSEQKYGVRWSVDDATDLGSRCFDAVGMSAQIGIGDVDGKSDFDGIYPWSDIKRCNIITDSKGKSKIIYEGNEAFALDGSNGNVFVRIPKFYVEKYIEDGYEYRTVSSTGDTPHPAFVENGKELDAIYVAAFEGYLDNGTLKSIAGVIPSSNHVAQTYLTSAKKNGSNYSLYDMRCVDAVWTLMAVEYGCRNTNQILGYGAADYLQPTTASGLSVYVEEDTNSITVPHLSDSVKLHLPVGTNLTICRETHQNIITQAKILSITDSEDGKNTTITFDGAHVDIDKKCYIGSAATSTNWIEDAESGALSWHTGRANIIPDSNIMNPVRYRWIENLLGNLWEFLPDITFRNGNMFVCNNMDDYYFGETKKGYVYQDINFPEQNDNSSSADVPGLNSWISSMHTSLYDQGIMFGAEYDSSLTSKDGFGAHYYLLTDTIRFIANGGGFDHLYRCNMLTNRAWISLTTKWYLYGARMMYKPVH